VALQLKKRERERERERGGNGFLRALTMQDSIIESKTINYILFMVFCWCGGIFIEEKGRKK